MNRFAAGVILVEDPVKNVEAGRDRKELLVDIMGVVVGWQRLLKVRLRRAFFLYELQRQIHFLSTVSLRVAFHAKSYDLNRDPIIFRRYPAVHWSNI